MLYAHHFTYRSKNTRAVELSFRFAFFSAWFFTTNPERLNARFNGGLVGKSF